MYERKDIEGIINSCLNQPQKAEHITALALTALAMLEFNKQYKKELK